jgi:hypothetical protein
MNCKNILFKLFLLIQTIFLSSCATIFSSSDYTLSVNSEPSGKKFKVENRKGLEVYSGKTPSDVQLDANSDYFKMESYRVKFPNYGRVIPVECSVDGWYWGNFLFGGLIGFLAVDPATGAMYKLDKQYVNPTLSENNQKEENDSASQNDEQSHEKQDEEELVDVVYLKNGSVIHGEIVEIKPGEQVKIKTKSGNVFVYEMSEVKNITKEKAPK